MKTWLKTTGFYWLLLLIALLASYSNHFNNAFHFDDFHTIVNNPAITKLGNIPKFYSDGSLFSTLPQNQGYRPLLSTTLALDYKLAGGLKPWAFHLDSFSLFLLHILAVFHLYKKVLPSARFALAGAAVFALHPVMAETVNYIIQRGDMLASFGCTLGLVLYARNNPFYPICFILAGLGKPNGVVFPLLLTWWMLWSEKKWRWNHWIGCGLLGVLLAFLHHHFTPPSYTPGGSSLAAYLWTQPYIICTYTLKLFWPSGLVADTDLSPFASPWQPQAIAGYLGLALLLALIAWAARAPQRQGVALGLAWFLSALLPTSLIPLAEVTNDHRMFFPFVGLILAFFSALTLVPQKFLSSAKLLLWPALLALALTTHERNKVWHTEESLWQDVAVKAPLNGRGQMNYGLALMAKGDYQNALISFNKAQKLSPNYSLVYINLGVLYSALGRDKAAQSNFSRARALAPQDPNSYFYEARWKQNTDPVGALSLLEQALEHQETYPLAKDLMIKLALKQRDWKRLKRWAPELLASGELEQKIKQDEHSELEQAQALPESETRYIELSFVYNKMGNYAQALEACQKGLATYSQSAKLWNNQAVSYMELKDWKSALNSAQRAVKLAPDWQLAKNNLNWIQQQLK